LLPALLAAAATISVAAAIRERLHDVRERIPSMEVAHQEAALARCRLLVRTIGRVDVPGLPANRSTLARGVEASGAAASVSGLVGARRIGAVVGLCAGLAVPSVGLVLGPVGAALGFVGPGFALSRRASRRMARIDEELPQLLDLLAAASHAGLAGPLALRLGWIDASKATWHNWQPRH
jgi:Flp pilus assembly protein TadB